MNEAEAKKTEAEAAYYVECYADHFDPHLKTEQRAELTALFTKALLAAARVPEGYVRVGERDMKVAKDWDDEWPTLGCGSLWAMTAYIFTHDENGEVFEECVEYVMPTMTSSGWAFNMQEKGDWLLSDCFSTREAAGAARGGE